MGTVTIRVRTLAAFAAGAMIAVAVTLMFVNEWRADAAPGDVDTTYVPITPCRLIDTRPATNVGPRSTPLGPAGEFTVTATGASGNCSIPADAIGVSLNITAIGASALSFITVWDTGDRPDAASLNPAPGEPPTPNAVVTPLSGSGSFNVYNNVGSVNLTIDAVGYFTKTSLQDLDALTSSLTAATSSLTSSMPFATNVSVEEITDLTASNDPYVEVEITAPVDGHVTVVSNAQVQHEGANGDFVLCGIFEADSIGSLIFIVESVQGFKKQGQSTDGSLSGMRTFEIAAGETVSYVLACRASGTAGQIFNRALTALFTPS